MEICDEAEAGMRAAALHLIQRGYEAGLKGQRTDPDMPVARIVSDGLKCAEELWTPVPEWECYEVSNRGNLRRIHGRSGTVYAQPHAKALTRGKYLAVTLKHQGRKRTVRIHTLVLEAFAGPRPDGLECRHLNGDSFDNRLENLRWGTHQENYADEVQHGTAGLCRGFSGLRKKGNKITPAIALAIRARAAEGTLSQSAIAREFGVSQSLVSTIVARKKWKHL